MTPSALSNVVNRSASTISLAAWSCCAHPPDALTSPEQLHDARCDWLPAQTPGTVASALRSAGRWTLGDPLEADADDWWYRTSFKAQALEPGESCRLCLDGLATLADVWLNGELLLTTDNMFRAYRVDVTSQLQANNELVMVFRSLANDLHRRRARPRWKTNLVNHQQLRWRRTTLLGRIPGWSPPVPAVGPWRPVRLEVGRVMMSDQRVVSAVHADLGTVTMRAHVDSSAAIERAKFCVGPHQVDAQVEPDGDGWLIQATLFVPNPPLWWPHTHGCQPLLACSVEIITGDGCHSVGAGQIGFRELEVLQSPEFSVRVNGVPVYCRGACWTVADIATLDGSTNTLAHDLRLAKEAGVNMLRVGGTMIYESDTFYRLCDEYGILVWQDFMFANMDYPVDDVEFAGNIRAEARHQLSRLCRHPCIAVYCGNSEVEQQAAMLGIAREFWRNRWAAEELPALCAEYHPGAAYVPSTPTGGVMPFHVRDGIAHYYGVGAYLRPPQEVRRADVKFTPECLAFANVPEPVTVDVVMHGAPAAAHHPLWKQRIPRDSGAGWDFEDVRDHYLRHCFGVDPIQMRSFNMDRYLQLSRAVTGEIMTQVFSEWRSNYSHNHGGLVWFFKDLWPGAGWGIVDSLGNPKAAYYYLRRVWQNRQIVMTDEGTDGMHLHIINECAGTFTGFVELLLLRQPHTIVARQETRCLIPPRGRHVVQSDDLLQGFYDVCYAYRFGAEKHDIVVATLYDENREVVSEAFHFLNRCEPPLLTAPDLRATAVELANGEYDVQIKCDCFLQSVYLDVNGFRPDDNYFHLAPARSKKVRLQPLTGERAVLKGYVAALNLCSPAKIMVGETF